MKSVGENDDIVVVDDDGCGCNDDDNYLIHVIILFSTKITTVSCGKLLFYSSDLSISGVALALFSDRVFC